MATRDKPPRPWWIDDLLDLGDKQGERGRYLKAVPVLILERWVRGGKEENVANYVWTNQLKRRIESGGLRPPFNSKGDGVICGALTSKQKSRNLTRPILIEPKGEGMFWINLPYYESLLQEYREKYFEKYSEDYKKLFPDEEPGWRSLPSKRGVEHREAKPTSQTSEMQDEIQNLLAPIEQALRDRQQEVAGLIEKVQNLQTQLATLKTDSQEKCEIPYHTIWDEELRDDCESYLESRETYIDAIRRAGVVLEERLRKTIGGEGHEKFEEGVKLVDYALLPESGRLIISEHPAEQDGVRMLFRGALQFVRNPPAHKKVQYDELEAWQTISLIDYLLSLLRQAKLRKT